MASDPTPQRPVVSFPVPNVVDAVLVELWSTSQADYRPLDVGTPHPNAREFPGFRLGKNSALDSSEKWVRRVWVTDAVNEDAYNYAVKYTAASDVHPVFVRAYREPRDTFTPRVRGAPLRVVYRLTLTAGGANYTTPPVVTIAGGGGAGATGRAVLNHLGVVVELVLTHGGSGFTGTPSVAITGGGGAGATASATIQSTSAVLVEEEARQFDPASEYFGQYLNVIRVYQVLPGPTLPTKTIAVNLPDAFFAGETMTEEETLEIAGGAPAAMSASLLSSSVIQDDSTVTATRKTRRRSGTGDKSLTTKRNVGEFGGATVDDVRTLSFGPQTEDRGLMVLDSEVAELGAGWTLKRTVRARGTAWPILAGNDIDQQSKIVVEYTKQVVAVGTPGGFLGGYYVEVTPIDRDRAMRVASRVRISTLPASQTFRRTMNKSFPDQIWSARIVGTVSNSTGNIIDFEPMFNRVEGFSGACEARETESFLTTDQYAARSFPATTKWFPESSKTAIINGDGQILTVSVPTSLHPPLTLQFGNQSATVQGTAPNYLIAGSWIISSVSAEKWRLGIYKVTMIEVQIPGFGSGDRRGAYGGILTIPPGGIGFGTP